MTDTAHTRGQALLRLLDPDYVAGAVVREILAQDLTRLHARQLLAQLRRLRAAQSNQLYYAGASAAEALQEFGPAITAVKTELAKRPHLPNKAETRARRQAAAKRR